MVTTVTAWGCGNKGQAEQKSAAAPEFATVERRDLDIKAEASGTIQPIRVVEVKSKASGEVLKLPVETGIHVNSGDLLAEIDPRDVNNAYEQAKADADVAEARLTTSVAQRARTEELRKANVATEQELESAKLDEANSRAALVKAKTALQLAEEKQKDVRITAPSAGTIITRTVEVGTIIASASQNVSGGTTLMTMADLSTMQVKALVDETDLGKIQPGLPVSVSVEAYPQRRFNGQVKKIEPQAVIDQNVTMFPVLVELDNSEGLLKVGMNADVEIQVAHRANVIVVPNSAVVSTRDAPAAGLVLGMTEEQVRTALRNGKGPVADAGAGEPQQPGDSAAHPTTPTGQAPAAGAASADCTALMQKVRDGGFQNISEADRTKLRECRPAGADGGRGNGGGRRGGGNGEGRGGGNGGRPRQGDTHPAVLFVKTATGYEPRSVTLGVNDFDDTEVIRGVEPGENVVIISVARLQAAQQEFLDNMRKRATSNGPIPGASTGPGGGGRGPGGGGGGGGGGRGGR